MCEFVGRIGCQNPGQPFILNNAAAQKCSLCICVESKDVEVEGPPFMPETRGPALSNSNNLYSINTEVAIHRSSCLKKWRYFTFRNVLTDCN